MSRRVRKHVYLDSADIERLRLIARSKGGRARGYTLSSEVATAVQQYVERQAAEQEEATLSPIWQRMLDQKFAELEAWLRPGVWGGATYGTTAALLLLELMCGKTLDPKEAKDHFELIRGRAWKIVRRGPILSGSGLRSGEDS